MDASFTWALRVGNIELIATFLFALGFVVVYAFQPWWQYESGRIIMALMGVITLVIGLGFVRQLVGERDWFVWLRVLVFLAVPLTIARCVVLLVRVQVLQRERERRESTLDDESQHVERYDDERDTED